MTGKYLVTTDNWFYAPDGKQYKAVWGDVEIVDDSFLGIKTNRNSVNWFAKIGTTDNHVIIAGCQIHYSVRCENEPHTGATKDYGLHDLKTVEYERPTNIYLAK